MLEFSKIKNKAIELGFSSIGIADPEKLEVADNFAKFLADGNHGSMQWLNRNVDKRVNPKKYWPEVQSIIMLGVNYNQGWGNLLSRNHNQNKAVVSVYASCDDYHRVLQKRLKIFAKWLNLNGGGNTKVFVDTSAVMEKPLAAMAGLGWQGKHTNLVSRDFGSWLFLCGVMTDMALPDQKNNTVSKVSGGCGSCNLCQVVCPTNALKNPYKLDVKSCISYLTIEHEGLIPYNHRKAIGNHLYGCDDCLAVCPWNKFAQQASEIRFSARPILSNSSSRWALRLSASGFKDIFTGSAIKRIGINRWKRNALIVAGNSGSALVKPDIISHLNHRDPVVRGTAIWAASQHFNRFELNKLFAIRSKSERDTLVKQEWDQAMQNTQKKQY